MALKIIYENKELAGPTVKVDRRLFLDTAGKLVEADDPGASALYCSPGKYVSRADFEARGGELAVVEPEPEPKPEIKAAPEVIAPKVIKKKVTKKKAAKKKATKKKVTKKKRS